MVLSLLWQWLFYLVVTYDERILLYGAERGICFYVQSGRIEPLRGTWRDKISIHYPQFHDSTSLHFLGNMGWMTHPPTASHAGQLLWTFVDHAALSPVGILAFTCLLFISDSFSRDQFVCKGVIWNRSEMSCIEKKVRKFLVLCLNGFYIFWPLKTSDRQISATLAATTSVNKSLAQCFIANISIVRWSYDRLWIFL